KLDTSCVVVESSVFRPEKLAIPAAPQAEEPVKAAFEAPKTPTLPDLEVVEESVTPSTTLADAPALAAAETPAPEVIPAPVASAPKAVEAEAKATAEVAEKEEESLKDKLLPAWLGGSSKKEHEQKA